MIDDLRKTELLMALMKESLPLAANITPSLARQLMTQSPDIAIPDEWNIIKVIYSGDMGGILCCLDMGGADSKNAHIVSITHLEFKRNIPFAREITAYQRHRNKKLKQQQARGF